MSGSCSRNAFEKDQGRKTMKGWPWFGEHSVIGHSWQYDMPDNPVNLTCGNRLKDHSGSDDGRPEAASKPVLQGVLRHLPGP